MEPKAHPWITPHSAGSFYEMFSKAAGTLAKPS
jgi:hypothetical protein